jgi:hypothetical protein
VLAFAEPFLKNKNVQSLNGSKIAIYVDNSLSLKNSVGDMSQLDKILTTVNKFVSIFSDKTEFYFVDNNFDPKDKRFLSKEKLIDRITEVKFSSQSKTIPQVLARLKNIAGAGNSQYQYFLFSDFQKNDNDRIEVLANDTLSNIHLIPFQNTEGANAYVDSIWLENPFLKLKENNKLYVRVKNGGANELKQLKVKFLIGDIQTGVADISLNSLGDKTISFGFTLYSDSITQAKVVLDDKPNDFDNQYFFILKPINNINILELNAVNTSYFKEAYQAEKIFNYDQNRQGNVSLSQILEADIIIINNIETLSQNEIELLLNNLSEDQVVLICVGGFEKEYSKIASRLSLLGLEATLVSNLNNTVDYTDFIKPLDTKNIFFRGIFEKESPNMDMPYAKPIFTLKNAQKILVRNDEIGVLYKTKIKNTNTFVLNTPLHKNYTNLHLHALFLPIVYKISSQAATGNKRLAYTFDDELIQVSNSENLSSLKLKNNKNEYLINPIKVQNKTLFELPNVELETGYYQILNNKNEQIDAIAINFPKSESKLDYYSTEELLKIFAGNKNIKVVENASESAVFDYYQDLFSNNSIWKYFLILALLAMLAEIVLVRILKNPST